MLSTCLSRISVSILSFFFFNDTATTEIYTLSLHDALPISPSAAPRQGPGDPDGHRRRAEPRGVGRRHARRRRAARPAGPSRRARRGGSRSRSPAADALAPDRLNAIRVAGFFVYWASGLKLEDTQSGYRAYPVALFDDVALRHGGFVLETEVLIAAAGRGWQVREVPVRAIPRARRRSRFRPLGDGVAIGAYLAGRVAARWAREAAAGGWWRHPRRRRAAAAATATLAAPVLLVLLALQALVARRLPDVVTPLVERLCSQVRLDLAGEPERAALMTLAVPPEAPR